MTTQAATRSGSAESHRPAHQEDPHEAISTDILHWHGLRLDNRFDGTRSSPRASRTRSFRNGHWAATCGGGPAVCDWIGSPPSPGSAVDSPAEIQSSAKVHGSSPTASGCGSDPG